jgi:transposase InsO family protein
MYEVIRTSPQHAAQLPVTRMCEALALSRAEYDRWQAAMERPDPDMELRDQRQRIALEIPAYGYRRMTHELHRRSFVVNHKRVLRLMREDNLLCLRKQGCVRTTHAQHGFAVYPNLIPELTLSAPNQLWVADITYVRLQREFIYVAVILDAYSRRCIGWALDCSLEAKLAFVA